MPTEPTPFIFRIEQRVCNNMLLSENVIEEGVPPADFVRFAGTLVSRQETPMGISEQRHQFPIDAKDRFEAFRKYKDAAQAFIRIKQAQANAQIAIPMKPKGGLILPG